MTTYLPEGLGVLQKMKTLKMAFFLGQSFATGLRTKCFLIKIMLLNEIQVYFVSLYFPCERFFSIPC